MDKKLKDELLDAISLIENTAQNEGWHWIETEAASLRELIENK